MSFTIGSLFDGSGGFPLAAFMCGGIPVWASEIEPYPIAVTKTRFPHMKHIGSVTDVKGNEIEPVNVITFGSPCQDLSVAGKRAGLKHTENGDDETTRSGLFMEAVRIIKEMREATNGVYPRFALWENVPGAFSSNKGKDFRIVLEELIKIVEPSAAMPPVPKTGWPYSDCYSGDGWSLAYRVLDAQYWGVPQRRRRIYLVLDLGGECAHKVLFERKGLRGYFAEGRTPWQAVAGDAEGGSGAADCKRNCVGFDSLASNSMKSSNPHSGCRQVEVAKTLDCFDPNPSKNQGGIAIVESVVDNTILDDQGGQQITVRTDGKCPTLRVEMHGNVPCVMESATVYNGENITSPLNKTNPLPGDPCHTLGTDSRNYLVYCLQGNGIDRSDKAGCNGKGWTEDVCYTLNTMDRPAVCYANTYQKCTGPLMANSHPGSYCGQDAYQDMLIVGEKQVECCLASGKDTVGTLMASASEKMWLGNQEAHSGDYHIVEKHCVCGVDCRNFTESPELYPTLQAKSNGGQSLNYSGAVRIRYIVRRLTPTECARLQGFPDGWGHPDHKNDFTDEEYEFWLNVRNTHAEINGKTVKSYTKTQMLTWYNKLHTDSSEYKLWGNGIALPTALYVMQGIEDVLS